ncbi:MAG TPA: hypothetical protein DHW82_10495 [Spirochaetia bacterium]|nr:MAG: hypothetical protein A2Y41_00235 [Spirochaetes bacterium GWB1_36_13]HCL57421.1 hypothetical protein [Spirochaetia bacterium]
MPSLRKYRSNSIIYFEGDVGKENEGAREILLIREGKILLTYKNVTGETVNEVIGKGEFFGVRSAITRSPREERATCIENCEVLIFEVPEFEELIKKNPPIGLKILRMLSNNLRLITREEKKMITQNTFEDPGTELYKMGLYFFSQRAYSKAIQIWKRLGDTYPDHPEVEPAKEMIQQSEEAIKTGYHPTIKRGD